MLSDEIIENARCGNIGSEDALRLLDAHPFELFDLANDIRLDAVGDTVSYVINRNIYLTNQCIGNCGFCAFKQKEGYVLTKDQVLEEVRLADDAGAVEVCVQGGYTPKLTIDHYTDIFEAIKVEYPEMNIHGLSPMEVFYCAGQAGMSVEEALIRLKESGLGTLTGTSAEILVDRVREIICPDKLSTQEWTDTIITAHDIGLRTNSTIMYGHVETVSERLKHIFRVQEIQEQTGGFTEFIPMPFMPYNNRIGENMMLEGRYMTGGIEDLQLFALSRIILHKHIDNIQAPWVKLGIKLAQTALYCGANDLGGTLMEDHITTASGGSNGEYTSAGELEWMIRESGRTPMKRNALYEECI
ncbi:5-amino-6-(D-ribitylamino)uracil--L-tyrosine 4-hydroxyphenyl transferase CofH [Methanolobus halotolerans]|uniref:5-amino-6-(D-ribitylamino)uracil--L-tyrosine 4-hydroxyphenyl transferase n=1 Tax=Methanolobus halotolerans TaxID=2052935 RepID=A0A4E0Q2J8_9EURY|nr:5-amino-6-(D-ribitylamino)uracil--L-tyrosine 4-hydroxyphenyl transferase CofH [Methanolobus halotolerans]TGC07025.1 7,8-didemethyl-8-hydroxy-5-deazariboflavin synthase subunit CofH [Methanolobus halotolerans]